ncbi:hypothetical protein DSO57_1003886 [Entomophthora muscae]|uniref:Uncharacterized protein n=1 Tax=Entomophthora muscae TaxID=34485 RepID=A0ACC2RNB3_9FUNG|nr:hypothetical protein DSO57_1003886 [Entomophthora muscae]
MSRRPVKCWVEIKLKMPVITTIDNGAVKDSVNALTKENEQSNKPPSSKEDNPPAPKITSNFEGSSESHTLMTTGNNVVPRKRGRPRKFPLSQTPQTVVKLKKPKKKANERKDGGLSKTNNAVETQGQSKDGSEKTWLSKQSLNKVSIQHDTLQNSSTQEELLIADDKIKREALVPKVTLTLSPVDQGSEAIAVNIGQQVKYESGYSLSREEYEIETIMAKRGTGPRLAYLVKWRGFGFSECTWEPKKNLACYENIQAFEEALACMSEGIDTNSCDPGIQGFMDKHGTRTLFWILPKNITDFFLAVSEDPGPAISVVNTVDNEGPPEDFIYINKSLRAENVPPIDPDFIEGCKCSSCLEGTIKTCKCFGLSCGVMPYSNDGLLQLPRNYAVYECNMNCSCPKTCPNRIIQRGRSVKLQIFRTSLKGWGVRALERIPKGHFIAEFVGEIITGEEADRRGLEYDAQGRTYIFDLDYNYGPDEACPYSIDAFKYGNITHFINHSCNPNLAIYAALYESSSYDIHNLALFAIKDIDRYEELCYDYSGGVDLPDVHALVSENLSANPTAAEVLPSTQNKKYICHCGANNCRGYIHNY